MKINIMTQGQESFYCVCHVCMCTHVYNCVYLYIYVQVPEEDIRCPALSLCTLLPWDKVSHWIRSMAGNRQAPVSLLSQRQSYGYSSTHVQLCLAFYMNSRDLNSGPHACVASALTHYGISPDLRSSNVLVIKLLSGRAKMAL